MEKITVKAPTSLVQMEESLNKNTQRNLTGSLEQC